MPNFEAMLKGLLVVVSVSWSRSESSEVDCRFCGALCWDCLSSAR